MVRVPSLPHSCSSHTFLTPRPMTPAGPPPGAEAQPCPSPPSLPLPLCSLAPPLGPGPPPPQPTPLPLAPALSRPLPRPRRSSCTGASAPSRSRRAGPRTGGSNGTHCQGRGSHRGHSHGSGRSRGRTARPCVRCGWPRVPCGCHSARHAPCMLVMNQVRPSERCVKG